MGVGLQGEAHALRLALHRRPSLRAFGVTHRIRVGCLCRQRPVGQVPTARKPQEAGLAEVRCTFLPERGRVRGACPRARRRSEAAEASYPADTSDTATQRNYHLGYCRSVCLSIYLPTTALSLSLSLSLSPSSALSLTLSLTHTHSLSLSLSLSHTLILHLSPFSLSLSILDLSPPLPRSACLSLSLSLPTRPRAA
jgi:hypothetical protein